MHVFDTGEDRIELEHGPVSWGFDWMNSEYSGRCPVGRGGILLQSRFEGIKAPVETTAMLVENVNRDSRSARRLC